MSHLKNELGHIYGRLTVIAPTVINNTKGAAWLCRCTCGNEVKTTGKLLRSKEVRSCGCLRIDHAKKFFGSRYNPLDSIDDDLI